MTYPNLKFQEVSADSETNFRILMKLLNFCRSKFEKVLKIDYFRDTQIFNHSAGL